MIKINVYQSKGEWFGARWIDGEYDGCDGLVLAEGATAAEAVAYAATMPLSRPEGEPREVALVASP